MFRKYAPFGFDISLSVCLRKILQNQIFYDLGPFYCLIYNSILHIKSVH